MKAARVIRQESVCHVSPHVVEDSMTLSSRISTAMHPILGKVVCVHACVGAKYTEEKVFEYMFQGMTVRSQ